MNKTEQRTIKSFRKTAEALIAALTKDAQLPVSARDGVRGQKSQLRVQSAHTNYTEAVAAVDALLLAPTAKAAPIAPTGSTNQGSGTGAPVATRGKGIRRAAEGKPRVAKTTTRLSKAA